MGNTNNNSVKLNEMTYPELEKLSMEVWIELRERQGESLNKIEPEKRKEVEQETNKETQVIGQLMHLRTKEEELIERIYRDIS